MVALPRLADYDSERLRELRSWSPAFARYEGLIGARECGSELHDRRHRAWVECAAATYFKSAPARDVCRFWSHQADAILAEAWDACGLAGQPAALFALGKHGAQELNLSSDIDLLIVAEPREALTIERGLRSFQALIQKSGDTGFCFRLDFDLRPGGKMGPLLTSPSQFQDYYWSQGETWERLAMVRLRPLIGPATLIDPILELARKFSYRKFLDFTLLEDLKALRSQVHQFGFTRREGEIHIKLEVGGIRDIELFVHSLLVLHGGKIPALRTHSTDEALTRISTHGLLDADVAETLRAAYWDFRQAENLAQAVDDRQTHILLVSDAAKLGPQMIEVNRIVSSLLGEVNLEEEHLPDADADQSRWLQNLGFSASSIHHTWPELMKATALSHKNDRDERARRQFLHTFVGELAKQPGSERDLGLGILGDFVRATRAKATFFTMLLRSPRLIQDLARLFCTSPYLGSILAARPELLDHFILRSDDSWSSDLEVALQQMNDRKLLTEIWAANQFLVDRELNKLFERVTETADEICRELLARLRSEFPGSSVEIVAMGKWGGRELGVRSDLDFVFLCDGQPTENDFKVARRFISRLADPHRGGNLYEVDLRLRPSGQSGAIIVGRSQLDNYWRETARPWERQAYLRARPLNPAIKLDRSLLFGRPLMETDLDELREIRSKLLVTPEEDSIDIKYAPGGLLDIEFAAQTALLAAPSEEAGCSTGEMIDVLTRTFPQWAALSTLYDGLREIEQVGQLASATKLKTLHFHKPAFLKTASLLRTTGAELQNKVLDLLKNSRATLEKVDPIRAEGIRTPSPDSKE